MFLLYIKGYKLIMYNKNMLPLYISTNGNLFFRGILVKNHQKTKGGLSKPV